MGPFQMLRNSLQLARDATGKQSPLNARSWPVGDRLRTTQRSLLLLRGRRQSEGLLFAPMTRFRQSAEDE